MQDLELGQISRVQSQLFLVTISGHSLVILLVLREFFRGSYLQPIFDYTSAAMALALALALASTSAKPLYDSWIPIGPMTVQTASLREAMCFSPAMELSLGSLGSKL